MLEKNDKSVVSFIWSCFVNMFKDIFFWGADLKKHLRHHMQHARCHHVTYYLYFAFV